MSIISAAAIIHNILPVAKQDAEIADILSAKLAVLAQYGDFHGVEEVSGSNPLSSTTL
ncbi:MAG: hypothetical protein JWQ02_3390 [Capsulimonas sp.]|jgi:hypothetical protein|nr:hypothetical protein [Capsulimonas sp.]